MKLSKADAQKFALVIAPVVAIALFINFPQATTSAAKSIVGFVMPGIFDVNVKPKKDFVAYATAKCEIEEEVPGLSAAGKRFNVQACVLRLLYDKRTELDAAKKQRRLEDVEAMPH